MAALAIFLPVIASQGSNAGVQTLTILVRGLALGEIQFQDTWRALLKEVGLGLANGLAIGLVTGLARPVANLDAGELLEYSAA